MVDELVKYIRDIPDFPKPGILFKDITPVLQNPQAFQMAVNGLEAKIKPLRPDLILAVESRGFLFGGALAYMMGVGLVVTRKPGKLPYKTDKVSYLLEYGSNTLEMHLDSIQAGQRVVIVDDLLATGGTVGACIELIKRQKGEVAGSVFVVELAFLKGREKLAPTRVESLIVF